LLIFKQFFQLTPPLHHRLAAASTQSTTEPFYPKFVPQPVILPTSPRQAVRTVVPEASEQQRLCKERLPVVKWKHVGIRKAAYLRRFRLVEETFGLIEDLTVDPIIDERSRNP
jgi:hypothetical protein